jgi:DnaJ-class molecular chaperone
VIRSREHERHESRIRASRPVNACEWCGGSGADPVGMPGEPCGVCDGTGARLRLRPWVRRVCWSLVWLVVFLLVLCTVKGW